MAHGGGDEGGGERWLVSYSDFITLLMVLFVVLYSMGQTDVKKYKQLADSMKNAFSVGESGTPMRIVDPSINQGAEEGNPSPIVVPGIPKQSTGTNEVAGELTELLSSKNLGSEVSVQNNIEGVLISLSEKLVFDQGTANLQAEAYPVLDTIADMLKDVDNQLKVVGHTDNSAPVDPAFVNNMALSLGRAMVISEYLESKGIDPTRITVAGRGEYEPIFENDTPEHRALNSRAEIVVIYNVQEKKIDVGITISDGSSE